MGRGAPDLAQDIDHNIQLQTEELQKLDEARERAWHDERAAATEQLADARLEQVESHVKQLERIKNNIRSGSSRCGHCENQGR